jgi:hypothetical protein
VTLTFGFSTEILYEFLISPMCTVCLACLILPDMIALIIFDDLLVMEFLVTLFLPSSCYFF